VYATAQGPLTTGGYDIRDKGLVHIKKNYVLVGRIPDGALVQHEYQFNVLDGRELTLSLSNPDFTSAVSMAKAINEVFERPSAAPIAKALDAATVGLNYSIIARDSVRNATGIVEFISKIENVKFDAATTARVVVNERTGTIVAGGDVRISEVAVNHGGIRVEIVNKPEVVQPQPFSLGTTEVIPNPEAVVEEKDGEMIVLNSTTTVSALAQALNSLGVTPRDIISIFQAIKEAGALHGQLVIM
jgi:flagellar P-ring protein precursor FlgI